MNNQIRQSIWSVADVVRKALCLPTPMCLDDLFNAIRSLGGECISVGDDDSLDFEARIMAINSSDLDCKFKIEYVKDKPDTRILFSIAHELGHLFLHLLQQDGTFKTDILLHRSSDSSYQELEANEFAAALLMPAEKFVNACQDYASKNSNQVNIGIIADYFNVSNQTATVRGSILQIW
ncbi:MAG: ImmA/IrrE family metallo-endopeptidase [Clostridia bacterium]|nr:ImmA/IrrE family metallo-endopeptidase [Clostridia bacterium]